MECGSETAQDLRPKGGGLSPQEALGLQQGSGWAGLQGGGRDAAPHQG